jgi:hypothetical protein
MTLPGRNGRHSIERWPKNSFASAVRTSLCDEPADARMSAFHAWRADINYQRRLGDEALGISRNKAEEDYNRVCCPARRAPLFLLPPFPAPFPERPRHGRGSRAGRTASANGRRPRGRDGVPQATAEKASFACTGASVIACIRFKWTSRFCAIALSPKNMSKFRSGHFRPLPQNFQSGSPNARRFPVPIRRLCPSWA